ncbi:LysM peptidoglycan-binding domain-containing protein [Gorillibacterium sp. sgz5001074]|uniref:LysM peptidoglycan-binding domain-containing protein n=1 Tax=Gorillibacterium sp. sgz5001074 TaxID=3446695 RepID=UPI003F66E7D0
MVEFAILLSFNNYEESFVLPVNPESFSIRSQGEGKTHTVSGLGSINIIQDPKLMEVSLSGFFPASYGPYVIVKEESWLSPGEYVGYIEKWKDSKRPIRFHAVSSTYALNMPVSIESFDWEEKPGAPGEIEYRLSLKKYVFYSAKKVTVVDSTPQGMEVKVSEPVRADERQTPGAYKLVSGDNLWAVAKRFLGDGSRCRELQELNGIDDAQVRSLPIGLEIKIPGGKS